MAIPFMMASVISAGRPDDEEVRHPRTASPVAAAAYAGRRRLTSSVTGKTYDYRRGRSTILHSEILLPEGADARFKQPGRLWSAAERAEWVYDRRTRTWRFRCGAEMARRYILALPSELTLLENIELLREFVQREFVDRGLAAEIVIHPSDDPTTGNIHAHVLVTSRPIQGKIFGLRATETRPEFIRIGRDKGFVVEPSLWPQRWAAAQERYFIERGIPLSVDPISICPRQYVGRGRHLPDSNAQASNRVAEKLEQELLRDPEKLLKHLSERLAVFGFEVARHSFATDLRRLGVDLKSIADAGGWKSIKSVIRYDGAYLDVKKSTIAKIKRNITGKKKPADDKPMREKPVGKKPGKRRARA